MKNHKTDYVIASMLVSSAVKFLNIFKKLVGNLNDLGKSIFGFG